MNLIDNAAQYSPAGSSIEISAWSNTGEVIVQVADQGPGLAPEEVERSRSFIVANRLWRPPVEERGWDWPSVVPSCRPIAGALGGNRQGGGACFSSVAASGISSGCGIRYL